MFPNETRETFAIFYNTFLLCIGIITICVIALFYVVVGFTVCLSTFVLLYIDSIERPWFVKFKQFVKRYWRMIFFDKTYRRFDYQGEAIRKGDSYIDKMLEDMFSNKDEDDPYDLEDSAIGFQRKIMFVNVSGEAKLYDAHIKGLSTLHRAKHCSLHNENNKLRVKADLGAGELKFHCKGSVKFMNFGPTVIVTGTLAYIEVFMEFKVNPKTGRDGKLTKFVIDDMRGMEVRVSGLGPINWAVNPIISGVTKVFKRFVRKFMEHNLEKHIMQRIRNYQFSVESETTETVPTQAEEPEETVLLETLPSETAEKPQVTPEIEAPEATTEPEIEAPEATTEPEIEAPEATTEPEIEAPEATTEPEIEAPEATTEPEIEAPEATTEPEIEAPEATTEPEIEAPEATTEPETEAPEATTEPETEAPEATTEPETEAPEATTEPETEAPEATTEPETEAPEATPEPETEAPEATPEPETEAPEATPEPETEAPEATPEPETEAPEATPETEAPEATPETEAPEATPETEAPEATPETEAPEPETQAPEATLENPNLRRRRKHVNRSRRYPK